MEARTGTTGFRPGFCLLPWLGAITVAEGRHPDHLCLRSLLVDNEGLRIGMFLGGLLMAAIPVTFGIWAMIFLFKKYREER